MQTEDLSWRDKLSSLYQVAEFRPGLAIGILSLSIIAALLEGFGLSFILPIIEVAQSSGTRPTDAGGLLGVFVSVYDAVGIPFTMANLVIGVAGVMTVRFTSSFLVGWLRGVIQMQYVRYLQETAFNQALDAEIGYFDEHGSDDILNAIVTQAEYAGEVIRYTIQTIEQAFLCIMYVSLAFYLAPVLTLVTLALLGGITVLFRQVLATGYSLGDQVADAKEGIQENAQAGTQGIRDVKLFGVAEELRRGFADAVEKFERYQVRLIRNQMAIQNFYQLITAVTVFVLIYVGLTFSSLTLSSLGVFLFAMFRLGPKASRLNELFYRLEGQLPHLVRTQRFVKQLTTRRETDNADRNVPDPVSTLSFEDVTFQYASGEETILDGVRFTVERGDFVAFVGPSGAGKSTIVSLLTRMYEPDKGAICADGISIDDFDIAEWREHVSVVRQDPYIFNDTLWRNVTVADRTAEPDLVKRACEIAQVEEFLEGLPAGYETVLGDQGVKLSGGQRQRVAIARALIKDADLLILDEATSDLDTSLEQKVHRGIESMERDYAMLVIAHRLSTVTGADRIYAMEGGEIVESGSHDKLISEEGTYADLYSVQITD